MESKSNSKYEELTDQAFQIDGPIYEDRSINDYSLREYRTVSQPDLLNTSLQIQVAGSSGYYLLLSEAYVEVQFNIQVAAGGGAYDGSLVDGSTDIALENGVNSMFSYGELSIGGVTVERVQNMHQVAHLRNLLTYSPQNNDALGLAMGFLPETGDSGTGYADSREFTIETMIHTAVLAGGPVLNTTTSPALVSRRGTYNRTFALRRASQISTSGATQFQNSMLIPLKQLFGFASARKAIRGANLTINLTRRPHAGMLFASAGTAAGQVNISKCSLWLPLLTPSDRVLRPLESLFASGYAARYPYVIGNCYYGSNDTTLSRSYKQMVSGRLQSVYAAIQVDSNDSSQTYNTLIYQNSHLTDISVWLNGVRIPAMQSYTPMYVPGTQSYTRPFLELQRMAKHLDPDTSCGITYRNFPSAYPIYGFDCSQENHIIAPSATTCDLEVRCNLDGVVKFDGSVGTNARLVVWTFTESEMEIGSIGSSISVRSMI